MLARFLIASAVGNALTIIRKGPFYEESLYFEPLQVPTNRFFVFAPILQPLQYAQILIVYSIGPFQQLRELFSTNDLLTEFHFERNTHFFSIHNFKASN